MINKKTVAKPHITIIITATAAILLVLLSLVWFTIQVNRYVEVDMHAMSSSIHSSKVQTVDNELTYLSQVTQSVAGLLENANIKTDDDIVNTLRDYANNAGISRTLFITVDGHIYTNYGGYLGQDEQSTSLDGISLSDISSVYISEPYFNEELKEAIFGILAPTSVAGKKGVLVSSYSIRHLTNLLTGDNSQSETGIITPDGTVIIGRNQDEFGTNIFEQLDKVKFLQSSMEKMKSECAQLKVGSSVYSVNNISRHCVYAPIAKNDWIIITTIKEDVLKSKTIPFKKYGAQLAANLFIIMLGLMAVVTTVILKEQKKSRAVLIKTANTDGLTGVYNRLACEEIITNLLEKKENSKRYAVLIFDLDNFKEINDTNGHATGDDVLKKCANLLMELFDGVVGRIGGDEFIVFVHSYKNKEDIESRVNEFLDKFYVEIHGEEHKISASIGICWGENTHSFKDLYKKADSAMYSAKKSGKGKYSTE